MDKKTLSTVALTLLIAYVIAKTRMGNQFLDVQRVYFR